MAHITKGAASEYGYDPIDRYDTARRLSAEQTDRDKLSTNDMMMSAQALQEFRDLYFGKTRKELTQEEKLALDELAQRLAWAYGDEFSSNFAWDTKNVVWNKTFDSFASRYVVEANLPFVLQDVATDPEGKLKDRAMRNISIATHGKIKPDTPVYELLKFMGLRGDDLNPERVSDQYSDWLFYGYYNGRRANWGLPETLVAYAADFGEDAIPAQYRETYKAVIGDFDRDMAYGTMILNVMQEANQVAKEHPEFVGISPDKMLVPQGYDANVINSALADTVISMSENYFGEDLGVTYETTGMTNAPRSGFLGKAEAPSRYQQGNDALRSQMLNYMVRPTMGAAPKLEGLAQWMTYPERAIIGIAALAKVTEANAWQLLTGDESLNNLDNLAPDKVVKLAQQQGYEADEDINFWDIDKIWAITNAHVNRWENTHTDDGFFECFASGLRGLSHGAVEEYDQIFADAGKPSNLEDNGALMWTMEIIGGLALDIALDKGMGAAARGLKTEALLSARMASADAARLASKRVMADAGVQTAEELTTNHVRRYIGRQLLKVFPERNNDLAILEDALTKARGELTAQTAMKNKR